MDLLERAKSGRYWAPPVRRVHISKGKGQTRPIGIPTFEDKVLQRAVHMVLEPLYERDFLDCSYGFRPGRSAHDVPVAGRELQSSRGARDGATAGGHRSCGVIPGAERTRTLSNRRGGAASETTAATAQPRVQQVPHGVAEHV